MNFNLLNSIIFAGIIQGIIFVDLVASNTKYQNKTIFFLLSLIVIYILYSLQYYLHDIRFFTDIKAFYGTLYINWTLAMAPLGLWHGLSIMYPNKKITLIQKAHIIPFVLGLFIIMYYKLAFRFQVEYPFLDVVLDLIVVKADIFAIFHNLLVLGMLAYHINSYKNLDPYIRQILFKPINKPRGSDKNFRNQQ